MKKTCLKCHENKDYTAYRQRSDTGKLRGVCYGCEKIREAELRALKPVPVKQQRVILQKELAANGLGSCPTCKKLFDRTGSGTKCRTCMQDYHRLHRDKYLARSKNAHYKRSYGLTEEQWREMKTRVCGCCGIRRGHYIDHCHKTGKVRDTLCVKCNTGLGQFDDDIEALKKAIEYLRLHNEDTNQ